MLAILGCLLLCSSNAQQDLHRRYTWVNDSCSQFILHSRIPLDTVRFIYNGKDEFTVLPDSILPELRRFARSDGFSLLYAGHRYLLERYYHLFPYHSIARECRRLFVQPCYFNQVSGSITATRIQLLHEASCPSNQPDMVFQMVRYHPGFQGGTPAFETFINELLKGEVVAAEDSVCFVYAVLRPDSAVHAVEPLYPARSALAGLLEHKLKGIHRWQPYVKDGRNMAYYLQLFLRKRKDGSWEADYLH